MSSLPFRKKNYQIMVVGLVVLALGFTLMAVDKQQFGTLGLTIAPIVILGGFVTEIFAILHTPGKEK